MKLKTKIGKSEIHGKGLMAGMDLKPGENLGVSHVNNWPTKNIGENYNHSDNPNAMSKNVGNKKIVVPTKKLKQGEEITVDYRKNPELEQPEGFEEGIYSMMADGGPGDPPGKRQPIKVNDPSDPRLHMYLDSLNLYKGSQAQIKLNPSTEWFVKKKGNMPLYQNSEFSKLYKKNPGKAFKAFPSNDTYPSYENFVDPNSPSQLNDKKLMKIYKGLDFGYNANLGLWSTPDLWHSKIAPVGRYIGSGDDGWDKANGHGSWNPIYKKPVQPIEYTGNPLDVKKLRSGVSMVGKKDPGFRSKLSTNTIKDTKGNPVSVTGVGTHLPDESVVSQTSLHENVMDLPTRPAQQLSIPSSENKSIIPSDYKKPEFRPTKTAYRSQTIMEADPDREGKYRVKEIRSVPYAMTRSNLKGDVWDQEHAPRVLWTNDKGEEVEEDPRKTQQNTTLNTLDMKGKSFASGGSLHNMMEYPNGGGIGDLLPNTFAQVSPLSLNYQGPATRQASEIQPGVGITLGRTGIGGQAMKNEGFDVTGTANVNIPYSGGKPSVYGDLKFGADPWEIVPGRSTDAQAYGKIGAGYDPNIGFNAGVSGGAEFQFRNMGAPAYRNPDRWKQGALKGTIGPEAGVFYRSKQLQMPSGYQGDANDVKAGLTYGGRGSIEYQPFRFPLRLKAEGSLMYNPGAGKTIEGGDEAGKIQGKWQPGVQVSAKLPLSAFSKPKKTAMRIPPVKDTDVTQNDWVRNVPTEESPNMGYTQGRLSKSIWRTGNR